MKLTKIRVEEPSKSWPRRWSLFFVFTDPPTSVQMVYNTEAGVDGLLKDLDKTAAAIHTLANPPKKKVAKKKGN